MKKVPANVFYQDKKFHTLFVNFHDLYCLSNKPMKPAITNSKVKQITFDKAN